MVKYWKGINTSVSKASRWLVNLVLPRKDKFTNTSILTLQYFTMYDIFLSWVFEVSSLPQGAPKIKLYTDEEGHVKGDGLCCYLKVTYFGGGAEHHVILLYRWNPFSWSFSFFMTANIVTTPSLLRELVCMCVCGWVGISAPYLLWYRNILRFVDTHAHTHNTNTNTHTTCTHVHTCTQHMHTHAHTHSICAHTHILYQQYLFDAVGKVSAQRWIQPRTEKEKEKGKEEKEFSRKVGLQH